MTCSDAPAGIPAEDPVVLVVDDEPYTLDALRRLLSQLRIRVLTADSAASALEVFEQLPVSLVITDYHMWGMNGIELTNRIKADWPDTRVILLTGQANITFITMTIQPGTIEKVIAKPWKNEDLLSAVKEVLGLR